MWKRTKAIDAHATPASLSTLSEDTARCVAAWLTVHDLRHVVFTSKRLLDSMLYRVYCRDHVRLVLPVDPQACGDAVVAWKRARAAKRVLPTRVVCGLPSQLVSALTAVGIQDAIELVEITPTRLFYDRDRIPSGALESLHDLSHFPRLTQLAITGMFGCVRHMAPLDVAVIADGAPTLETFSASYVPLQHEDAFASLQRLRRVDFYRVYLTSWGFAAKLSQLEHFTCRMNNSDPTDINFLQWRPLKVLVLENCSMLMAAFVRAIEHVHLPVVEKLRVTETNGYDRPQMNLAAQPSPRLVDLTIAPIVIVGGIRTLSTMTQLRSLHLCWDGPSYVYSDDYGVEDASPLACLVNLEILKLRMSRRATTCRPLCALTRLRELHLVDGWLWDFVESLPWLEKLSVEEICPKPRRRTFQERSTRQNNRLGDGVYCPRLREVFVGESVVLTHRARQLIQTTQSLRLDMEDFDWEELFLMNGLQHLTSFEFRMLTPGVFRPSHWGAQPQVLASIHTLERLRVVFLHSPLVDLPWSLAGATRLRMISLDKVGEGVLETLAIWSTTLVQLEEIYLTRYEGKSLSPLLELHSLRIVGIENNVDCRRLRGARGVGMALPNLRAIQHDGIDCVWLATCPVVECWEQRMEMLGMQWNLPNPSF